MNNENEILKIKSKIKKLLALSKSNNENEAYIALKKANLFMSQYNINEDSIIFESVHSKATKTYMPWHVLLSNTIAWLYSCYKYRDCEFGTYVFTGKEINAFMASEMFTYLYNSIKRIARKSIPKNAKYKYRQHFKYGIADRICDRIAELGKSCSWAPQRNDDVFEAEIYIKKSITIRQSQRHSFDRYKLNKKAFNKGVLLGNNVPLLRQTKYTPVLQIT